MLFALIFLFVVLLGVFYLVMEVQCQNELKEYDRYIDDQNSE